MSRTIPLRILIVILALSALLMACDAVPPTGGATDSTASESDEAASDAGEDVATDADTDADANDTLKHAASVNHSTWDPHKDQRTISLQYLNPIYEGLLRETTDGSSFVPELATSWEEDESGITFMLREGVTFHDGIPFDASVVVANFERVQAEGHPVNKGFLKNIASVETVDDMTVRYNYSQFDGTVLLTLSRFAGKMISPAAFDTVAENNPVGTGPYSYNENDSSPDNTFLVYDVNPDYWNPDAQPVSRIELSIITDAATQLNGLLAGEFQTVQISAIPLDAKAQEEGMITSADSAVAWSAHILDRTGSIVPELADERVRLAMSYALDRDAYWQVLNIGFKSTQQALPGGYAFSEDIADLEFDMDKAMALMEEAGNPTFTVDVPSFGPFNARNAFLASSWEPLGISLNIIEVNNIFAGCTQAEGVFPIGICPINERHIKHFVENRLLETGFLNPFGHVDEEINGLYEEAAELPLDEAEPLYAEIAKISAERAYIIHFGWASSPIQYNPEMISGVEVRFIYPGTYYIGDIELK